MAGPKQWASGAYWLHAGELPHEWSLSLQQLTALDLSQNRLSGTLPDWSALSRLKVLSMSNNSFTKLFERLPRNLVSLSLRGNLIAGKPVVEHYVALRNAGCPGAAVGGAMHSPLALRAQAPRCVPAYLPGAALQGRCQTCPGSPS